MAPRAAKKPQKEVKTEQLNHFFVPVTPLRLKLAELTRDGWELYPLGDFLNMVHDLVDKLEEGNE